VGLGNLFGGQGRDKRGAGRAIPRGGTFGEKKE